MENSRAARRNVIASMFIYGTIGVFVRYIPLPSSMTAMMRGLIGAPFLLLVLLSRRSRMDWGGIRRNLGLLCLSGAMLGINWILLFEAYRYTTVATATLCYYFAPIFLVAASPFVFGEKMTARKLLCVLAALLGMVFVSGVAQGGCRPFRSSGGCCWLWERQCFTPASLSPTKSSGAFPPMTG